MSDQLSVPLDTYAQAVADQRNAAMDEAAQWQALARQALAERDQLRAELRQLRDDAKVSSPAAPAADTAAAEHAEPAPAASPATR